MYEIFLFEIKYRLKRPESYIFFLFLFLFALGGVDFVFQGVDIGAIKLNAPIIIAKSMAALTGITMIIVSLIMGVPIIRDFRYNFHQLLLINPIKKSDYLFGRFAGSFVVLLLLFTGLLFGSILSEFMPWRHPDDLLPFNLWNYVYTFCYIVLPILFFGSALFFATGALSKSMMVVYTQAIIVFVCFMLTKSIDNEFLQSLLDPFSLTTLTDIIQDWSKDELNSQLVPFIGVLGINKIFWMIMGLISLWFLNQKFDFSKTKHKNPNKKKSSNKIQTTTKLPKQLIAEPIKFCVIQQIKTLTSFHFLSLFKQVSFLAIVFCEAIVIIINSINLETRYGIDSFPKTHLIIEELQELSLFFFMVVLIFYSGEILWKEREAKLHLIMDSTPITNANNIVSKFIALMFIYVILLVFLIVFGIGFQLISGYYELNLLNYFTGFFLGVFPYLVLYTIVSFCVHLCINSKLTGFVLTLFAAIILNLIQAFGIEHDLFTFGGSTLGAYSELTGYEQDFFPYILIKLYWLLGGIGLLMVASSLLARGVDIRFYQRWKSRKYNLSKQLKQLILLCFISFLSLGMFIFINTNGINEYWDTSKKEKFSYQYETTLKKYEKLNKPTILAIDLTLDLYPEQKSYVAKGKYLITNQTEEIITEIHIQKTLDNHVSLDDLKLSQGYSLDKKYEEYGYYLLHLEEPLQIKDTITLDFKQSYHTRGFEESTSNAGMFRHGCFLTHKMFPTIGYDKKYEIDHQRTRELYNLPTQSGIASKTDPIEQNNSLSNRSKGLIDFEVLVSTDANHSAVAPGNLIKQWTEKDRTYFHYKMDQPMINFFAILSGKYESIKDKWVDQSNTKEIDLEIYHHAGHEYNLERMIASMKASLQYCETRFSPYLYDQLRIVEFPRYASFAQSFPGTIPMSESLGFTLDIKDDEDVDMVYFITAHETAHHWWGMQLEAANALGANMIIESLAQYTALMIMKENFPPEKIQQLLDWQIESYEDKRKRDANEEVALADVGEQDYIYYEKGLINFSEFENHVGEEKINEALRIFLDEWNNLNGSKKSRTKRYATTADLMQCFRMVTPDALQYLISDLFEESPMTKN